MSGLKELDRVAPAEPCIESAKRRQIVEGARRVFLALGFDAASMGEIARTAGVSKGTLYVYFKNKEELFAAIVQNECRAQAEQIFDLDPEDHDVGAVLSRLGIGYVGFLVRPGTTAPFRTVIAIAERMPEIGRQFYETGPALGITRLASYLETQVAAGVLTVEDCDVAAAQFLESCQAMLFKPVLLNFSGPPDRSQIERVVTIAVRTFLAAYLR